MFPSRCIPYHVRGRLGRQRSARCTGARDRPPHRRPPPPCHRSQDAESGGAHMSFPSPSQGGADMGGADVGRCSLPDASTRMMHRCSHGRTRVQKRKNVEEAI